MSAYRPYHVEGEDEDDGCIQSSDTELDLLDFDSDLPEPEIIAVQAQGRSAFTSTSTSTKATRSKPPKNGSVLYPDTEIQSYKLSKGCVIKPGDTVELLDHSSHREATHSGDFLRIKHIIMNLATDEVRLRGYRLRRTKYLEQIFDCE
jgi:DNA (cytosine-5)-methyltransferase 1